MIVAQEEEFQFDYKDARCKLWFFENKLPGYAWYVPKGTAMSMWAWVVLPGN